MGWKQARVGQSRDWNKGWKKAQESTAVVMAYVEQPLIVAARLISRAAKLEPIRCCGYLSQFQGSTTGSLDT